VCSSDLVLDLDTRHQIRELEDELSAARKALEALLREPHGCPFCDSGKLRNPTHPGKQHSLDCGFLLAEKALALRAEGKQS
jgi:hypothetical protein